MTLAVQLHLDFAPDPVRAHGLRAAHPRPLVSMGKRAGRPFRSWRTSPEKAWKYPELEYGTAGSSIAALVLDCDKPRAMACGLFELPPPNWIVRRPANNHAHVAWTLAEPVHRYPAARGRPAAILRRDRRIFRLCHRRGRELCRGARPQPGMPPQVALQDDLGRHGAVHPRPACEGHPVQLGAAYRPADRRWPERRFVRGRDALGRSEGKRRSAGAACVDDSQSGLRAPAADV